MVLHRYVNSEGEVLTIEKVETGPFEGQQLLVVHDDPRPRGTGIRAPMLLDDGLRAWLKETL